MVDIFNVKKRQTWSQNGEKADFMVILAPYQNLLPPLKGPRGISRPVGIYNPFTSSGVPQGWPCLEDLYMEASI